jgi:hypothetical protein
MSMWVKASIYFNFGSNTLPVPFLSFKVYEKSYELTEFASQQNRMENNKLFDNIILYVLPDTRPQQRFLQEIIEICGGTITHKKDNANFVIGPGNVAETWVLDSLSQGRRLDFNDFLPNTNSR